MWEYLLVASTFIAACLGALWFLRQRKNEMFLSSLKENFTTPRVVKKSSRRMLVVEIVGNPFKVAGEGWKKLFGVYFELPGTSWLSPPTPTARWAVPLDSPEDKDKWTGHYALELPENLVTKGREFPQGVKIQTWKYGPKDMAAEILHIGPYEDEAPTVEKLHKFMDANKFEEVELHEEEYISGPGMLSKGDPKKYLTIIRYGVKNK